MFRLIVSGALVATCLALLVVVATSATFTDQVVSSDNTFSVGTLYMSVDGECGDRGSGGGGDGGPGSDGNTGCTITESFSADGVVPGGTAAEHTFTIVNEGTLPGTLSAEIVGVVDEEHPDCDLSNWTLDGGPLSVTTLDANGGASDTATYPVSASLSADAPNACQGAVLTVTVTFDLVQL